MKLINLLKFNCDTRNELGYAILFRKLKIQMKKL